MNYLYHDEEGVHAAKGQLSLTTSGKQSHTTDTAGYILVPDPQAEQANLLYAPDCRTWQSITAESNSRAGEVDAVLSHWNKQEGHA